MFTENTIQNVTNHSLCSCAVWTVTPG